MMKGFNRGHIFFDRLCVSLFWQAAGAPLVDRQWTREKTGAKREFKGVAIRLPFMRERICPAIAIGWRYLRPGLLDVFGYKRSTALALLSVFLAAPAYAQDFGVRTFATQETLLKPGANRDIVFGARAVAKATIATVRDRSIRVYGRAQASAVPDGGATVGSVSFENLESFQSLELIGGLEAQAYGDYYITAFYGIALQIEGGRPKAIEASPKLYGAGVRRSLRFTEEPGWIFAGACVNEALGKGSITGCASVQVPLGNILGGRLSVIGDVYGPGEGTFSRVGIAFQL